MLLELNQISVEIQKKEILKNVSFTVNPGEIVGIVAPNGSGKTTLLRTIINLISPSKGKISIYKMYYENNREDILKKMFFLQDNKALYHNLTGKEHLRLIKNLWKSEESVTEVIEKLKMKDYIDKKVAKYSLGMKQRLLFAMCLVSSCDILLMDEPMNGLDPSSIKMVSECIKELKKKKKIILFSSHILHNVDDICDKVIYLRDGELVYETDTSNIQAKKYVYIHIKNDKDTETIRNILNEDEIRTINQGIFELEMTADKIHAVLNMITEQNIKFDTLFVGNKNSQQVYEDLYERKE